MFLLDTNVISEMRAGKPNQSIAVRKWAAAVPIDQQFLSVVTLMELERGVLSMERKDKSQGRVLRAWLNSVTLLFQPRLLSFGPVTALLCARLHVPDRMPEPDAMLAATAQEHRMTIVTRNIADFERPGVSLINPWAA